MARARPAAAAGGPARHAPVARGAFDFLDGGESAGADHLDGYAPGESPAELAARAARDRELEARGLENHERDGTEHAPMTRAALEQFSRAPLWVAVRSGENGRVLGARMIRFRPSAADEKDAAGRGPADVLGCMLGSASREAYAGYNDIFPADAPVVGRVRRRETGAFEAARALLDASSRGDETPGVGAVSVFRVPPGAVAPLNDKRARDEQEHEDDASPAKKARVAAAGAVAAGIAAADKAAAAAEAAAMPDGATRLPARLFPAVASGVGRRHWAVVRLRGGRAEALGLFLGAEGVHTAEGVLRTAVGTPEKYEDLVPPGSELARAKPDEVWARVQAGLAFDGAGRLAVERLKPWEGFG